MEQKPTPRDFTHLAFVVIKERSLSGVRFWLQWNIHLRGLSFFGGHIESDESPLVAASRELLEELGDDELSSRWQLDLSTLPPFKVSEATVASALRTIPELQGNTLPFYSARMDTERSAVCHYFELNVEDIPSIRDRLHSLSHICSSLRNNLPVIREMGQGALVKEAWKNYYNPFIRLYIKKTRTGLNQEKPYELDFQDIENSLERILQTYFEDPVSATLALPRHEKVSMPTSAGRTPKLTLQVRIASSGRVFSALVPYPRNGVFPVDSSDPSGVFKTEYRIWHPVLVEQPGYWAIHLYTSNQERQPALRVVFDNGFSWTFPVSISQDDNNPKGHTKRRAKKGILPETRGNLPLQLKQRLPRSGLECTQQECHQLLEEVLIKLTENSGSVAWQDEQDLAHHRLFTYSVHLCNTFKGMLRESAMSKSTVQWDAFCSRADQVQNQLFNKRWLEKTGRLQSFRPINAADAISRLMSFTRFPYPGDTLNRLPAIYRQLHPSFRGIVCPFETPESLRVGLTLQLAETATVSADGELGVTVGSSHPPETLPVGMAAGLVPFVLHNDAARAMMGAKNLKQAVQIVAPRPPGISTGIERKIIERTAPLAEMGLLDNTDVAVPGRDLLVAYMPFEGWNFEDGIVASQNLRESGVFDWLETVSYEWQILPGWYPTETVSAERSGANETDRSLSLLRSPVVLSPTVGGTPVTYFSDEKNLSQPVRIDLTRPVTLTKLVFIPSRRQGFCGRLHAETRCSRSLAVGDKLMGRHGNKGVISCFLPAEKMPRFPDHASLPDELRGRHVDLVLNPNGVISRMNIGQLIETQMGLARHLDKKHSRGHAAQKLDNAQKSWLKRIFDDHEVFDRFGRTRIHIGTKETSGPVVVGFQFFCRLKQSPKDKAQVRGAPRERQAYDPITWQPVGGRKRGGGQRIGEMEIWALAAYDAELALRHILNEKSDFRQLKASDSQTNSTWIAIREHLLAIGNDLLQDPDTHTIAFKRASPPLEPRIIKAPQGRLLKERIDVLAFCPRAECSYQTHIETIKTYEPKEKAVIRLGEFLEANDVAVNPDELLFLCEERSIPFRGVSVALAAKDTDTRYTLTLDRPGKTGMAIRAMLVIRNQVFRFTGRVDKNRQTKKPGALTPRKILAMSLSCLQHPGTSLELSNPKRHLMITHAPNGLCDPSMFSAPESTPGSQHARGFIRLSDGNLHPVLGPQYRPSSRRELNDKLTKLYAQLLEVPPNKENQLKKNISSSITKRLKGKTGLLRRFGQGRRVNYSGRFVIVPGPTIGWDECGLSAIALAVLLAEEIAEWIESIETIEPFTTWADAGIWRQLDGAKLFSTTKEEYAVYLSGIETYLREHPYIRVVLNRAPSLHRYSLMAFRPYCLPYEDGPVLRISPLVCNAFGADFDGDEMSVHLPISREEHEEVARLMSPTAPTNLLSLANFSPLAGFSQDFVLGFFNASRNDTDRERILNIFSHTCCRAVIEHETWWTKSVGDKLLQHLCEAHPDESATLIPEWMSCCFEISTYHATSFGYLELLEARAHLHHEVASNEQALDNAASELALQTDTAAPGRGFGELAFSGARGNARQMGQILVSRGHLDPGSVAMEVGDNETPFLIQSNLLEGMTSDEGFWAAFNGRSSMVDKKRATSVAGEITRMLVLAAWPWYVRAGRCSDDTSPAAIMECHWITQRRAICARCYGDVFGKTTPDGYPAGLIAAQSFGERGTQLSMQSFHTGTRAISVTDLRSVLNPVRRSSVQYQDFKAAIDRFGVYGALDERHIQVIWIALNNFDSGKLDVSLVGRNQTRLLTMEDKRKANLEMSLADSPILKLLMSIAPVFASEQGQTGS